MMTSTNRCRLCLKMYQESKNLYDENGCGNSLYDITKNYFHPKIININLAKHLTGICLECWKHISDFQSFQTSVMLAQKYLEISEEVVQTTDDDDDSKSFKTTQLVIKNENSVQSYNLNTKSMKVSKPCENSPTNDSGQISLPKFEIMDIKYDNSNDDDDDSTSFKTTQLVIKNENSVQSYNLNTKSMKVSKPCENSPTSDSGQISVPKLEIMDIKYDNSNDDDDDSMSSQSEFISDTEQESLLYDAAAPANKTNNLEIASSNQDLNVVKFVKEFRRKYSEINIDELIAKHMPIISCDQCSEAFKTFSSFYKHFVQQHPNVDSYFKCFCSAKKWKIIDSKILEVRVKDHFLIHDDPNFFKCLICGSNAYKYKTSLQCHITSEHRGGMKIVCKMCDQCFATKIDLDRHKKSVHNDGKFTCTKCGQILASNIYLRRHIELVHSNKPGMNLQCKTCDKTFKRSRGLREHETSHTMKDLYACLFCEETFNRRQKLVQHRNAIHPLEKYSSFFRHIK